MYQLVQRRRKQNQNFGKNREKKEQEKNYIEKIREENRKKQ